ncbi:MAG: amino acid racemase [Patescibacteria group bacterium]|nr:amino acid racemase [Patescibacteria group bacterium]
MKKSICILGGIGPQASLYMSKLLIEMSVKYFGVKTNEEFPEIILYSIPIPGFIANEPERKIALKMLRQKIMESNNFSISNFAIACNTAHILLDKLQKVTQVRFVSMIEEVVKQVKKDKLKKAGLLASPSTIEYGLYQKALKKEGIETIIPTEKEQSFFEEIVTNVLKGKNSIQDKKTLLLVANSLKKRGAEGIILGCTELPLVFPEKYSLPVYNSVAITAMALLRNYYK